MFDYYLREDAEQFKYIFIPKVLMTDELFIKLSLQAKILYGLLLDRMSRSKKNHWIDHNDHVYIIYPIVEIQDDMGASKRKIQDYLSELEGYGLIERKKQGNGRPNLLYIKNFILESA